MTETIIAPEQSPQVTQVPNQSVEMMQQLMERLNSMEKNFDSKIESKVDAMKVEIPTTEVVQHNNQSSKNHVVFKMDEIARDAEKMSEFLRTKKVDFQKMRDDQFYRGQVEAFFNEIKDIGEKQNIFSRMSQVDSLLTPDGRLRQDLDRSVDVSLIASDKAHAVKMAYQFLSDVAA